MASILLIVAFLATTAGVGLAKGTDYRLSHLWIAVAPGAPERAVLERAGFHVSPVENRHQGQGTASATVEFDNAYLEFVWADSSVSVSPGLEVVPRKFRRRSAWRTTGWSPFGLAIERTAAGADSFPFPTWRMHMEWMPPDKDHVVLTPKADSLSPSIFVTQWSDSIPPEQRSHSSGVHRVTAVAIRAPKRYVPTDWYRFAGTVPGITTATGSEWCAEVTLDGGRQRKRADLRPTLPLVLRY